jgi:hypothetical protein
MKQSEAIHSSLEAIPVQKKHTQLSLINGFEQIIHKNSANIFTLIIETFSEIDASTNKAV